MKEHRLTLCLSVIGLPEPVFFCFLGLGVELFRASELALRCERDETLR
jgi:hypothetical protein